MIKSLWMLVASLLFALMAAFARMGASDFSALELVFYRSAFGAAVIALWVWAQGFTLRTPLVRAHFMRSFLGTFALTIWFYAISKLPLGTAMTLNYTSPLYMALIVIFLAVKNGESFSRASAAAVVLGFFGVTLVLKPELSPGQTFPALVGLTSGFFAALAYFQIRQLSRMQEPEWRIVFYFTLFGTVWGLGGHLLLAGGMTPVTWDNAPALLGMAVTATGAPLLGQRQHASHRRLPVLGHRLRRRLRTRLLRRTRRSHERRRHRRHSGFGRLGRRHRQKEVLMKTKGAHARTHDPAIRPLLAFRSFRISAREDPPAAGRRASHAHVPRGRGHAQYRG